MVRCETYRLGVPAIAQSGLHLFRPHRGLYQPRNHRRASGKPLRHLADVWGFTVFAGQEDRIMEGQRREALIDDPSERHEAGPSEVSLQLGGLVDRRGLGKRHQQYARELGIAQTRQQFADGDRHFSRLPRQFSMIRQCGIQ